MQEESCNINPAKRFRPAADVLVVEEHGTVYLIPPLKPPLRLNRTASELWHLIGGGATLAQVVEQYAAEFSCSAGEAQAEVFPFIVSMMSGGLLLESVE